MENPMTSFQETISEKVKRAKKVERDLGALKNYVFAADFGYNYDRVKRISQAFDVDIGKIIFCTSDKLEERVQSLEEDVLVEWEKKLSAILSLCRSYPAYQQML